MNDKKYLLRQLSSVFPFTMILLSSIFMLLNLSGCDDNDEDPPPPPSNVKVFVTSLSYDGNFAGAPVTFTPAIDGADDACTTAATNAGLTGTWTAWLSDNDADAADRIFTGGAPYETTNGTVIAANFTDLTDGMLDVTINIDEFGNAVRNDHTTWTATALDGRNPGVGSCQGWTTNDVTQRGRVGYADHTDASWTDAGGGNPCDVFNRLYCFADAVSP